MNKEIYVVTFGTTESSGHFVAAFDNLAAAMESMKQHTCITQQDRLELRKVSLNSDVVSLEGISDSEPIAVVTDTYKPRNDA
jgi:hypothetical protein